ncbi:MAG: hypothetical protein NTX42_05735 [Methanothrix sp.]|nr:hypothetical protein [Methanothrix sp.]
MTGVEQAMAENASAVEAEPPKTKSAPPVQKEPGAAAESQQGPAARRPVSGSGRRRRRARGRWRPSPGKGRSRCSTASAI